MRGVTQFKRAADIVLSLGALASVAVSLYVYYSTSVARTMSFQHALRYYVITFGAAVALIALRRLNTRTKVASALFLVSVTFSLYALEIFLYAVPRDYWSPRQPFWGIDGSPKAKQRAKALAERHGVVFDTREKFEVVMDLRERGIEAVPSVTALNNLLVPDGDGRLKSKIRSNGNELVPLGAIANTVTVLCNENGSYVTYESGEQGFNNPRGLWQTRRADIVAVGDSFTHGYCVPPDRNFVSLIRRRYPATLNLGMAGHGPLLTLATISEYLPQLRPKIVLWFYYEQNDLVDFSAERKSPILTRYLEDTFKQSLAERQREIDRLLRAEIKTELKSFLLSRERAQAEWEEESQSVDPEWMKTGKLNKLRGILMQILDRKPQIPIEASDLYEFERVLSMANARVGALGGQLYFVYLPSWVRYAKARDVASEQREKVLTIINGLDIPIIDLHPAFIAQLDPLALFPFREYGHYTEQGHQMVAEKVLKALP